MSKNTIEINQYKLSPASVSVWGEIYGAIQDQKDLINLLDSYLGSAKWGQIEGDINEQEDLIDLLSQYVDRETVEQAFATYDAGIKAWVEAKGYLTEHQDISGKADVSYVDAKISDVESQIPSLSGYATETYVDTKISEVESEIPSVEGLASVSYVDSKISDVESQIPSVEGLASVSYVDAKISDVESQIPSLAGYATETWVEGKGYLTQHQPIKTINSQSLIGTGDIVIEGGGQKYNEVDTIEDLDDLTPNQGDIAVVANASTNVLTQDFLNNPQFLPNSTYVFRKKDYEVNNQTSVWFRIYGQSGNIWFGVRINPQGFGLPIYQKAYSTEGDMNWQEWSDDEFTINTPSQIDGAMRQSAQSTMELLNAVSLNLTNTNIAYEYKDGVWGQTTNKEYVDAAAAKAKYDAVVEAAGRFANKMYVNGDPEGQYGGETGSVAYNDNTYWVKLRDSWQPTGWKLIKEFNKFFKYTTVNDRDADTYACENGNICEVLGEQQGTEEVSIMSQDLVMNPRNYLEAGKTYTFSIKDGVAPEGFVLLFHYRSNGNYHAFGPQYNWNLPFVWGKWDADNGFVEWDGTPFTVEIPSNAEQINWDNTQGEWQNSYQWFDITTEVPVYGPSTFYIYENGWKQLVVANDLKTINQQSIVGTGDITISGGGVGQSEGANAGEIFNCYEGTNKNVASGQYTHAEGIGTQATGFYTHTEGYHTQAAASNGVGNGGSHAEGVETIAFGNGAHAEGRFTKINSASSALGHHAEGNYNVWKKNFQHTVGIGTSESARKNGHLITNTGKHYIPNVGGYIGTEESLTNVQDVATVINNKLDIPSLPTADGNYVLKCTITDGVPTYTWVSE